MGDDLDSLGPTPAGAHEPRDSFALENPWLLRATLSDGEVQARLGTMVAYQGVVGFERSKVGWRRILKRAVTPEGGRLMKVSGTGDVYLAHLGQQVHRVHLDGDEMTCNSRNLLAFESGIDWDIQRVRAGLAGKIAGGLFNTYLRGTGWVALLSDGKPLLLRASEAPTFTDPQAAIAWSGGLATSFDTEFQARTFIGLGSGESIRMGFAGDGWVLVQPSEGRSAGAGGSGGGGGGLLDLLAGG